MPLLDSASKDGTQDVKTGTSKSIQTSKSTFVNAYFNTNPSLSKLSPSFLRCSILSHNLSCSPPIPHLSSRSNSVLSNIQQPISHCVLYHENLINSGFKTIGSSACVTTIAPMGQIAVSSLICQSSGITYAHTTIAAVMLAQNTNVQ